MAIQLAAFLGAGLARKLLCLAAAVPAVYAFYDLALEAIDSLYAALQSVGNAVINGIVVPILDMMSWMGFFEALKIIMGAYLTVIAYRMAFRLFTWCFQS